MDESLGGANPVESEEPGSPAGARGDAERRLGHSSTVPTFLVPVLVGLLGLMAWQGGWVGESAASGAARRLRDGDPAKRVAAIGDVERFGPEEPGVALRALRGTLEDGAAEVRAAGAVALVMVIRSAGQVPEARDEAGRAVGDLFGTLKDPAATVRASGAQALWLVSNLWEGPADVVDRARIRDALLDSAADPDEAVRLAAVRGLGAVAPRLADDPPPALVGALGDASAKVRTAAAEALVGFHRGLPPLLPSLVRSFEKAAPRDRPPYRLLFDRIRPPAFGAEAVLALGAALSSPDDEVRRLAATALRGFAARAYPAIPALVTSLGRPGRAQEQAPAPASSAALPFRLTPDDWLWWTSGPGAADSKDPALAAALTLLRILPAFPFLGSQAPPPIDSRSFAVLAAVLGSGRPELRATVAYALGRLEPSPETVASLGRAAGDPDASVRIAALKALHDLADRMPFAPPQACRAALEDASPGVRYWSAGALGHIALGLDPYIPALLEHAGIDPDPEIRGVCVLELREFVRQSAVTPGVVPLLTRALDHPSMEVRCAASGLLGRLGPASAPAVPGLIRLLGEPANEPAGRSVPQYWAALALGRVAPGTPQADRAASALVALLRAEPSPLVAGTVLQALPAFGPLAADAVPRLRVLAKSPDPNLSGSARKALATLEAAPETRPTSQGRRALGDLSGNR